MVADRVCPCTIYNTHALPRRGEPAGRWQAGPAYVRGTLFDVRFGRVRRLRREFGEAGGTWRRLCTMYDVRFIHNVRVAQIFFGSLMYAELPLEPSS